MLKKVYIEITNSCNLRCDFCIQNTRTKVFMTESAFCEALKKLKGHTNYLYFHILGEPLLHPQIRTFIHRATEECFYVNITTNGYLITKLRNISNLRQLNISLHSYDEKYHVSLEDYLNRIFEVVDTLKDTYVSYRLWVKNSYTERILTILNTHYKTSVKSIDIDGNVKLKNKVFINSFHEFVWPNLDNDFYSVKGTCYALRDHIGILVDGTIVPCCLDSKGDIKLGNVFSDSIDAVLRSDRVVEMKQGFQNKEKCEELCRHCSFIDI